MFRAGTLICCVAALSVLNLFWLKTVFICLHRSHRPGYAHLSFSLSFPPFRGTLIFTVALTQVIKTKVLDPVLGASWRRLVFILSQQVCVIEPEELQLTALYFALRGSGSTRNPTDKESEPLLCTYNYMVEWGTERNHWIIKWKTTFDLQSWSVMLSAV